MRASIFSVGAATLALAAAAAFAGDKMSGSDPATFVKKAAQDGMVEVELGKVAQQKASNADVKAFSARMVKDHGKANEELKALAKPKNLMVPAKLDAEHQAMVDEMSAKSGAEFDAAYSAHMAADHSKAIDLFTQASQGSDADLAGFAKKTLPTLKEHKTMADQLTAKTRSAAASDRASTTSR